MENTTQRGALRSVPFIKYYSVIKSRRIRCAGRVAGMGEWRNVYSVLVGKPEGNSTL
jgi:hypothetical protein